MQKESAATCRPDNAELHELLEFLHDRVVRDGDFSIALNDGHLLAVHGMSANECFNPSFAWVRKTMNNRLVRLVNMTILKGVG